jgi:hypothetical protein
MGLGELRSDERDTQDSEMNAPAAGWYKDPAGSGGFRYWDGNAWTTHVQMPEMAPPVAPGPVSQPTPAPQPLAPPEPQAVTVQPEAPAVTPQPEPAPQVLLPDPAPQLPAVPVTPSQPVATLVEPHQALAEPALDFGQISEPEIPSFAAVEAAAVAASGFQTETPTVPTFESARVMPPIPAAPEMSAAPEMPTALEMPTMAASAPPARLAPPTPPVPAAPIMPAAPPMAATAPPMAPMSAASSSRVDLSSLSTRSWVQLGGALLGLVGLILPWATAGFGGSSNSFDKSLPWLLTGSDLSGDDLCSGILPHGLLFLIAFVIIGVSAFKLLPQPRMFAAGAAAGTFLLGAVDIMMFRSSFADFGFASLSVGIGAYLTLLAALVAFVGAILSDKGGFDFSQILPGSTDLEDGDGDGDGQF